MLTLKFHRVSAKQTDYWISLVFKASENYYDMCKDYMAGP